MSALAALTALDFSGNPIQGGALPAYFSLFTMRILK